MYPFSIDSENNEFAAAGPMVRIRLTESWHRPFVAPSDARFGAAAEM
jgi:hypothetical protein